MVAGANISGLSKAMISISVNGIDANGLLDSGSTDSFINQSFAKSLKLKIKACNKEISMATTSLAAKTVGHVYVTLDYVDNKLPNVKLTVLEDLCADVIIGHDILKNHSSLEMTFGGPLSPLKICGLAAALVPPPPLFSNLTEDCKPIADKSRKYSTEDMTFIRNEVDRLLKDKIIEPSNSPWRAQVVVIHQNKKRMVVDYSRTVNRFTLLDAYPLPRIDEMVRNIAKFEVYSTLDLQSAYHQVKILKEERPYTAFEADGKLYQFCRIPFGVTNGVACFQRIIDTIISTEKLANTFAYVDNLTICGRNQEEHDAALEKFKMVAKKYNLTFNESKSIISVKSINLLGYCISKGSIKPDPNRLQPLLDLQPPTCSAALKRILGFFSYYAQWIPKFSETIYPLVHCKTFPLSHQALNAFSSIKNSIAGSVVAAIEENVTFVVETDASEHAIAATLNQGGRPVAFFSKTLSQCEQRHSSVEKEAYAIVEAIRKWRHFLIGKHFTLMTDQRSVAFMFNYKASGKVKNEKILRWRIELSCYSYDIVYRPGVKNSGPDTLSKNRCASVTTNELYKLHDSLCHPGVTRFAHFVKCRNLPYSIDDIKKVISSCSVCAKIKPSFYKPPPATLIKATQSFERLNIDFKGPVPSSSPNKHLLTIVDEYSRFPFAYPCPDVSSNTVTKCLSQLFSIFGMPSYVHSDRGAAFMSKEVKHFLHSRGIATSRTSPYNGPGNGQVERYNGIIWNSVQLALESRNLPIAQWEMMLPDAMHSIRSLLCTATNETPH